MAQKPDRIEPRNLTARLAYQVGGNPALTRPEDAVANCYPGLELDIRNLDRRFFPGLVFEFVARNDVDSDYSHPMIYGAKVAYVDAKEDPDLQTERPEGQALYDKLTGGEGSALSEGAWYLAWIEQGSRRITMDRPLDDGTTAPLDGLVVWRLVRSLERGPVKIGLRRRDATATTVELEGWRRQYTDPETGVISTAYQPGEMLQSLCSPWQHDFRDCYCHYWVANHPDVVLGEVYPGEPTLPGGAAQDAWRANTLLDWLRRDRSRAMAAGALDTFGKNRPYQYDAFEINTTWQNLNVVIGDTEIGALYVPESIDTANPFGSPEELAKELRENLAGLEFALTCEYLYSRFSLLTREEAAKTQWRTLPDEVNFVRHHLLLIATSEMQHLRWVNELLWELHDRKLTPAFEPVLAPSAKIPMGPGAPPRDRALRRLESKVLDDYIAVEAPSGSIDGAYARVVATLRDTRTYGSRMIELAQRIVADGMQHESLFLHVKAALRSYEGANPPPYLRTLRLGTAAETAHALGKLDVIIENLQFAYAEGGQGHLEVTGKYVALARLAMTELLDIGEALAAQGIGIPFFHRWDKPSPTPGTSTP